MRETYDETISCLSTLIFDRLAQASTRIQIVRCIQTFSLHTFLRI